jgi:hypothetical protein
MLRGELTAALIRLEFAPVAGDTMSHHNVACLYATTGRRDAARRLNDLAEAKASTDHHSGSLRKFTVSHWP